MEGFMAEFILSAFADEAAAGLDEQLEALEQENIRMIELRGVDGVNCSELGVEDAVRIHKKLEAHHVTLSALGSPYGKIGIRDSFDEHFDKFARSMEVCKVLECSRIRMFSFYIPQGEEPEKYRDEVFRRLERMVELARKMMFCLSMRMKKEYTATQILAVWICMSISEVIWVLRLTLQTMSNAELTLWRLTGFIRTSSHIST